ncbi:MAG: hypothetical protein ABSG31_07830 [Tepidisphaeraceae bacterium]|jgi:hypothetical protein
MRNWLFIALPLLLASLGGCAAPSAAQQASLSQSHLDQQVNLMNDALTHVQAARQNLAAGADASHATANLDAGIQSLEQALALAPLLRQDITALSNTAVSLQKQIDAHRNDLFGPRAIRIRNRLILVAILVGLGAALLQLGPLLGGPFGGGLIVAGHLLTAFIVPLGGLAFKLLGKLFASIESKFSSVITFLDHLGNQVASSNAKTPTPTTSPAAATIAAGSD